MSRSVHLFEASSGLYSIVDWIDRYLMDRADEQGLPDEYYDRWSIRGKSNAKSKDDERRGSEEGNGQGIR